MWDARSWGVALLGYEMAVTKTFFLPVALTGASLIGALGMQWSSVQKRKSQRSSAMPG